MRVVTRSSNSSRHRFPVCDVAIVGGGFSGSMVATHLLRSPDHPASVALIEKGPEFGRGVAYRGASIQHLLNVPAAKMSAFPEDASHFVRWLESHPDSWIRAGLCNVSGTDFVPRAVYGEYVQDVLEEAIEESAGELHRLSDEVVDVQPYINGAMRITLASGEFVHARKVVLAVGNFPPGDPSLRDNHFHRSERYLHDPWSSENIALLASPGDVLILGSGLTGLDLLQRLQKEKTEGIIHVLSRRGLFPQSHRPAAAWPSFLDPGSYPQSARKLLRRIKDEVLVAQRQGVGWRSVIDALRPHNAAIWKGLPLSERRRFLRHLRPYWESHRHRAAERVLAVKTELERAGRLRCHRGRLKEIAERDDLLRVTFNAAGEEVKLNVSYVVNCTGPESNFQQLDDPLIVQLFARGLIRPDPLFLGLDVDEAGGVVDVQGRVSADVFTLGSPRKGKLMETTAVPEIRVQARDLAERLLSDLRDRRPMQEGDLAFDPAYEYHI